MKRTESTSGLETCRIANLVGLRRLNIKFIKGKTIVYSTCQTLFVLNAIYSVLSHLNDTHATLIITTVSLNWSIDALTYDLQNNACIASKDKNQHLLLIISYNTFSIKARIFASTIMKLSKCQWVLLRTNNYQLYTWTRLEHIIQRRKHGHVYSITEGVLCYYLMDGFTPKIKEYLCVRK